MISSAPLAEFRDVTVQFGQQIILEDVNFVLSKGEFVALIGPNGAGKTTLIRVLLGLVRPSGGEIRVFGKPPWRLRFAERRRIGYVPQIQDVQRRFPFRVYDVVMMGRLAHQGWIRRPSPEDREAVEKALALTQIQDLKNRPIASLSGGQWQRMLIARALSTEPDLLILDEPTAGLDVHMTEGIYELLNRLHRHWGVTILLATHDIGVVTELVDRVACLSKRLVAHGRPQEVLTEEVLQCMYGRETLLLGHGEVPHIVLPRHRKKAAEDNVEGSEYGRDS